MQLFSATQLKVIVQIIQQQLAMRMLREKTSQAAAKQMHIV